MIYVIMKYLRIVVVHSRVKLPVLGPPFCETHSSVGKKLLKLLKGVCTMHHKSIKYFDR
jgi:hypothetical protein